MALCQGYIVGSAAKIKVFADDEFTANTGGRIAIVGSVDPNVTRSVHVVER